jgi:hypothetical protein
MFMPHIATALIQPGILQMDYNVRASTLTEVEELQKKVIACMNAGAE